MEPKNDGLEDASPLAFSVFTGSMLIFGGVNPKQPGAPLPRYEIGLVRTPDLPCFLCSFHETFFSSTGRYKDAQMLPGHGDSSKMAH